jgi:hypothetical protein
MHVRMSVCDAQQREERTKERIVEERISYVVAQTLVLFVSLCVCL